MIKNKGLILSLIFIILNFPVQSFAYSLNNFQQMATSDGNSNVSQPDSNSSVENIEQPGGNNTTELDGAIGAWQPGNDELPNFDNIDDADIDGNKPIEGQYFTISATVPIQMEFLIKNENENGSSPNGKFITPYYNVKNNGSYPLSIVVESFEDVETNQSYNGADVFGDKLYVSEPQSGNGRVEMKLHLTYDRISNSYLNKVDLQNVNNQDEASRTLGIINSNEVARIYYGSELWETPKSEDVETGVASTFKLKLAFSLAENNNIQ